MQRLLAVVMIAAAVSGCSTVSVNRAQGAAEAGKAFTQTMGKVNDLALDRSISFTADFLSTDAPRDEATLNQLTSDIRTRSKLIGDYKAYLQALADYFSELEGLSKGDQSEGTATALGKVLDSLKAPPTDLKISDDRKKALTGLAGLVAKQVHAAAVERALTRDADDVAQAIAVSEKVLDEQIRWISFRERAARELNYTKKVRTPFLSNQPLTEDWKKSWSAYVRTPPTIVLLEEAREATATLQKAWRGVLRGEYSFAELQASLLNVKAGVEALTALKDSK